jgi:hypothetical protein
MSSEIEISLAPEESIGHWARSSSRLAAGWLILGISALVMAGLFSILLVLARTPYIQNFIPYVDFFHTALVVHVDLSVMIWFLAFAGMLWSIYSRDRMETMGYAALLISAVGTAVIAFSPFLGADKPLMNNYIPVLDHRIFLSGLVIYAAGFSLLALRSLAAATPDIRLGTQSVEAALRVAVYVTIWIAFTAMAAFAASYASLGNSSGGLAYYEALFWGGGHTLQFVHTGLMLISWLWLQSIIGDKPAVRPGVIIAAFAFYVTAMFAVLWIYVTYKVGTLEHREAITEVMEFGMGLPAAVIGLPIFFGTIFKKAPEGQGHLRAALVSSILLFAAGGSIGFLIEGVNVIIPAHYHGAIVGVTLAFMGVVYHLLPKLGFGKPSEKLAKIQAYVYGSGQFLHILGLAWAGGYGVQRKIPGMAQGLDTIKKIAGMGLMGMGGMIAVAGGVLFLVVVISAMRSSEKAD